MAKCPKTKKHILTKRVALQQRRFGLREYPCAHCGGWHMTHMNQEEYYLREYLQSDTRCQSVPRITTGT